MAAFELICKVSGTEWITPTVFLLRFIPPQKLDFLPGQWASLVIPGAGKEGKDLRRAYSISSPPEQSEIELCIKLVPNGPGTQYLSKLKPGENLKVFAPYGAFVYKPKLDRRVVFLATGTGISPFRCMTKSELFKNNPPAEVLCLFGGREQEEVLFENDFAKQVHTKFVPCLTRASSGWNGFRGRITDYLRSEFKSDAWENTDFYLCGNGAMIDEAKLILAEKGIGRDSIHQEIYYKPKPGEQV